MKKFILARGIGSYLAFAAIIIGLFATLMFIGANNVQSPLVPWFYISGLLGVIALGVSIFFDYKGIISMIAPAFFILAFVLSIYDNATAFMLQFNGVAQGTGEMGRPNDPFWITVITLLVSALIAIAAAFFDKEKQPKVSNS
jgi:uncharacterized membrane protein